MTPPTTPSARELAGVQQRNLWSLRSSLFLTVLGLCGIPCGLYFLLFDLFAVRSHVLHGSRGLKICLAGLLLLWIVTIANMWRLCFLDLVRVRDRLASQSVVSRREAAGVLQEMTMSQARRHKSA
jgi:hypothetical protein